MKKQPEKFDTSRSLVTEREAEAQCLKQLQRCITDAKLSLNSGIAAGYGDQYQMAMHEAIKALRYVEDMLK